MRASLSKNNTFRQELLVLASLLMIGILMGAAHSSAESTGNTSKIDTQGHNGFGWVVADEYSQWTFAVNNGQFDIGNSVFNYWTHADWPFSVNIQNAGNDPTQDSLTSTVSWQFNGLNSLSGTTYNNIATTPNSASNGEYAIYYGDYGVNAGSVNEFISIAFEIAIDA